MNAPLHTPLQNSASHNVNSSAIGTVRFDFGKSLWMWSMFAGTIFAFFALSWQLVALTLVLTFFTVCLGHSVGLHRGIIHRTYDANPWVRGALAYLCVGTGLGGPLSWARLHAVRDYWQNQSECPRFLAYEHSMARDFVWNLHFRFDAADDRAEKRLPDDVMSDGWLQFLEKTWPLHNLFFASILFTLFGADGVAVAFCGRVGAAILGHWAVGYAAHVYGEQRYLQKNATESGRNIWLLGVLAFGEGFHNNHHAHPDSARMGEGFWELDVGYLSLKAMQRLGLVKDVRAFSVEEDVDSEIIMTSRTFSKAA